ncbi:MAG: cardiolipin synthase [Clostridia bacterium]|nr:cardiolipin synthase [Clostridia bacterium]
MNKSKKVSRSPDNSVLKIRTEKNAFFGTIKVAIVALLVIAQLAIQIFLYSVFAWASGIYSLIAFILSLISCIFLISSNRSTASKAVWTMIILLLFQVGFILYVMTNPKFFFRRPRKRFKQVFARSETQRKEYDAPEISDDRVREDCEYLNRVGGFTPFTATETQYFPSGGQLFDDVLEKVAKAEKFVFIEFFIISDGVLLERFISLLTEKVKAGVDVRIIYDDLGSRSFSRKARTRIKKSGIKLMTFNKLVPMVNVVLNIRDHRKIVVVDGKFAYTGGANLADEYTNESRLYGYWKDEGIRVEGEAVDGFTLMFLRQWDFLTRKFSDFEPFFKHADKKDNNFVTVPFSCGLDRDVFIGKELYLNVIAKAQKKLYLMTPYLVPDDAIFNMLCNKAQSGCDVRIVLPAIPDKPYVYVVSLDFAARLLDKGVKIYLMRDSFVHSKIVYTDYCAIVGSINIDLRSFYQQFESALYTNDEKVLKAVGQDFENTFAECEPLTKKKNNAKNRLLALLLKVVSPLM